MAQSHDFIVICTGRFNPKDQKDWCYRVNCACGWEDIAWSYEDATGLRAEHRKEQGLKPNKSTRKAERTPRPKKKRLVY